MATGRGDLRFRPWPSLLRLPESSRQSHGARWFSREGWRLPRFYPSRDYLMPLHEYPARYATGYLGDIGVPSDPNPMDFSAWFEAYLGGHWHTFDARHNRRRIGRVLIGRGRDAGDVPIAMVFGQHLLEQFSVITEEIDPG